MFLNSFRPSCRTNIQIKSLNVSLEAFLKAFSRPCKGPNKPRNNIFHFFRDTSDSAVHIQVQVWTDSRIFRVADLSPNKHISLDYNFCAVCCGCLPSSKKRSRPLRLGQQESDTPPCALSAFVLLASVLLLVDFCLEHRVEVRVLITRFLLL